MSLSGRGRWLVPARRCEGASGGVIYVYIVSVHTYINIYIYIYIYIFVCVSEVVRVSFVERLRAWLSGHTSSLMAEVGVKGDVGLTKSTKAPY